MNGTSWSYDVTDAAALRRGFAAFATGVTIVAVGGEHMHGMTANAFASVSLEPPLVLVCVDREALMHTRLPAATGFGISVLAAGQEEIARHFASRRRPLGAAQFESVDWVPGPVTGAPLIAGALATFECELWRTCDGGDHTIFIGEVVFMDRDTDRDALLFLNGRFTDTSGPVEANR
ncbi:flavin reductase family protein [Actinoplanes siamensis]|uniref:Oxidoreductase n=1 Tax=Actinoplanes siamensis TaxID=1223317 RepID=A0A919NCV6_9ACTN|nr:flavin reductase family protein [Actinoplanes siamensis]GIF08492.1 oxidoreductase [Actinoplanes siamensis]